MVTKALFRSLKNPREEEETQDEESESHFSHLKTVKSTTKDNVSGETKDLKKLKSKRKRNVSGETKDLITVKSMTKDNVSGETKDLKKLKSKRKANVSGETKDLITVKSKANVSGETNDLETVKSKRKTNVSGETNDLETVKSKKKANVSGEISKIKEGKGVSDSESDPISKTPLKRTHEELSKTAGGKSVGSFTPGLRITRLWSDVDEVTVLNGMIEYKKLKGHDPNNADLADFYNFIRGRLQDDFSMPQLKNKIPRFKKRFRNALKKRENGEDPVFSRPHEIRLYELSKKIWDEDVGKRVKRVKKGENVKEYAVEVELDRKGEAGVDEEVNFESKYPFLSGSFDNLVSSIPSMDLSESGVSFGITMLSSIENGNAEKLNGEWKQLIREEIELNQKKLSLMKELMEIVLDH